MGLITDLHPLNVEEEKTKFFESDSYNPQFRYVRTFSQSELSKYGYPTEEFEKYILKMIARHQPFHFPTYPEMSTTTFSDAVNNLCIQLKIPPLPINFSPDQTARVMLTKQGLRVRTPIFLDSEALEGLLNHEIQTHYLRRLNHQYLPIEIAKAQDPIQVKYTEEGLALLHTYLPNPQPFLKQFVACYAQILAQQSSFRTVYNELLKIGLSPEMSFRFALKQKRGVEDTARPGGFTKIHVYLEGAKVVSEYLLSPFCQMFDLYAGKVSVNSLADNKHLYAIDYDRIILPLFTLNITEYLHSIEMLHQVNFADT